MYIKVYSLEHDEEFQVEIDVETARKAQSAGAEVSEPPFPKLPIRSRSKEIANRQRSLTEG